MAFDRTPRLLEKTVGKQADLASLPERLREREVPNGRRPQTDFVFEGGFPEL